MSNAQKISFKTATILGVAICLVLAFCAVQLRSHLSVEWDEGAYLTTFQSLQNGFPAYQQTFLSQPPGFLIAIFPLYSLFGSTLETARLAVFCYSLLGLMAVIWVGWELDCVLASFVAISVLYAIPIYYQEILTFHADSLPSTFSILALAAALRFRNTTQSTWVAFSSFFVAVAVLIKADISILPAIALILVFTTGTRQQKAMRAGIFTMIIVASLVLFTLPFGLENVMTNVIKLRIQAASHSSADASVLFEYLQQQPQLIALLIAGAMLGGIAFWRNRDQRFSLLILFSWSVSTLILLLVFRPLLPHHLVLLALPLAVFFSVSLVMVINRTKLSSVAAISVAVLTATMLMGRLNSAIIFQESIPTPIEVDGIDLIQEYTKPDAYIVSDDGLLTGLTRRRTPPNLTDLSYIRLSSGNLTAEAFKQSLDTYKPAMILMWNGRLLSLPGFSTILNQYHYRLVDNVDSAHKAYLLGPS